MEQTRKSVYDQISKKHNLLKRQFYGMRMKDGTKIEDHLNVFNTLNCQLSSMDVKIDDKIKQ